MRTPEAPWIHFALLLTAAGLSVMPLAAQDFSDPPPTVARISYLNGEVALQPSGTNQWADAPLNYPMVGGDRIYTSPGSRALVQLGGAELRVWQATDLTLTNVTEQYEQLGLAQGAIRLRVFEMDPGSQIEVDTPNGAVLIESAGDYRINADPASGSSVAVVDAGHAQITGPNVNLPLSGGYAVQMYGTDPIELQYLNVPPYDDLDAWSMSLDYRLSNSISARYVSRQMVGFADLDAYGTWVPQSEYGPVWYPSNVPQGWRPYSLGHWAYIAPWGYTWVDDAPWGFAPFHYGRWSVVGGRWGWIPGPPAVRPVYSPALVVFVGGGPGGSVGLSFGGGGGGVAAWFPIGVGEPYVPWYRCTPTYARQVNVTNVNVAVIHNTTIVNNYNTYITNVRVNNTTVNNVTVKNISYSNRTAVTAVPAAAMSSGAPVARQQVRLSPQQQQQLAQAPISVRPTAPVPATPHPSLVAKANVPQPPARPTLMTPTGQSRAVPSAAHAAPVVVSQLPAPKIVPKNAPPPPSQRVSTAPQGRPNPSASLPARPTPPAPPAPVTRPAAPVASQPGSAPARGSVGAPRPATTPIQPAPTTRPAAPRVAEPPAPSPQVHPSPAPVQRPSPQARPSPPPAERPMPPARTPPPPPPPPPPPAHAAPDQKPATKPAKKPSPPPQKEQPQ